MDELTQRLVDGFNGGDEVAARMQSQTYQRPWGHRNQIDEHPSKALEIISQQLAELTGIMLDIRERIGGTND